MASATFQNGELLRDDDSGLRQALLLGFALLLSFLLHAGVVLIFPKQANEGAVDFGSGGVVVSLGAAGREAGGKVAESSGESATVTEVPTSETEPIEALETLQEVEADAAAEAQVSEAAPDIEAQETFDVESLETSFESVSEAVTATDTTTEPEPEAALELAPDPTSAVDALALPVRELEAVEAVETQVVAETVTVHRTAPPLPKRRPNRPVVHQSKQPNTLPAPEQASITPTTARSIETQEELPGKRAEAGREGDNESQSDDEVVGEGGKSGSSGLSAVGDGDNTPGGGTPGAESDYYQQVLAWLEKHKRYPRRSKLRNEQGVVMLSFVVARDGSVSISDITQSSGHKRLDKEALGMIERAQPLPAMPADMGETEINLVIPVKFELR